MVALILIIIWLLLVAVRFRRSKVVLIGGLFVIGLFTLTALIFGKVTPAELGLGPPKSWLTTILFALVGLAVMIAYSPLADRLASRWFIKPPTLQAFGAIQQSLPKLIAGILAAWVLGGFLEELVARGIVLNSLEAVLTPSLSAPVAAGIAICVAAAGAGMMHFYQGPRAMAIITQISILFGILFVVSGHNLWAVVICHGLYDTIAFVRFATKKSKYANMDKEQT
jgi:membrane protease YdiL (CAAX protease family)